MQTSLRSVELDSAGMKLCSAIAERPVWQQLTHRPVTQDGQFLSKDGQPVALDQANRLSARGASDWALSVRLGSPVLSLLNNDRTGSPEEPDVTWFS